MARSFSITITKKLAHIFGAGLFVVLLVTTSVVDVQAQVRRTDVTGPTAVSSSTSSSRQSSSRSNNTLGINDSTQTDSVEMRGLEYHKETPDSVLREKVFMFRYDVHNVKIDEVWNPTLDPTGAQFATDVLDGFNGNYYLSKGIVGQPHIGLFPTFAEGLGNDLQPDVNDGYAKRKENIWLYQTMTPYSKLTYGSSLDKDYQVGITHTQNIIPGWNFAFDYKLMCPDGNYPFSGVKNHYLDATTNYFSRDSRLQAVAGVIWQAFNIGENGGILDDSYFTQQLISNRAGVPVNIDDTHSRNRETELFAHVTYNLVRQVDSYRERDSLAARFINDTLTVMDTIKIIDTIPIRKPRVINAGVFGAEISRDYRKRVFADSTMFTSVYASIFWTNDAYPDYRWRNPFKLKLGIYPDRTSVVFAPGDEVVESIFFAPFVMADIALWSTTLHIDAEFESDDGDMNHFLGATYSVPFDSAGNTKLDLSAFSVVEDPDIRYLHDASWELRSLKSERYELHLTSYEWLDFMLRASHLSHNVWYDSTMKVVEGSNPLWLYQAALTTRLKAGWFHYDMQQLVQYSTDEEQVPVPLWATKNSIYADMHLFSRAMRLQVGIDLRYHTPFYTPTYDYYTGLFYHQSATKVGGYIWGDVFVNVQVKRASIYAKAGHVNALWETTNPTYFLLPHYPGRKFGFFWGLTWNFFD